MTISARQWAAIDSRMDFQRNVSNPSFRSAVLHRHRQKPPTIARRTNALLVIEVAHTSLAYDLGTKMPLYARHGIPEVWAIDAATRRMRVLRQPIGSGEASRSAGSGYATEVSIEPNEAVSCAGVVDDTGEQVVVELARLLPTVG